LALREGEVRAGRGRKKSDHQQQGARETTCGRSEGEAAAKRDGEEDKRVGGAAARGASVLHIAYNADGTPTSKARISNGTLNANGW